MKYVKLTNGRIYDVGHHKIDGHIRDSLSDELFVAHSGKSYGTSMPGVVSLNHLCNVNDIVEEADTIEELCDCFVDYCEEDDSYFVSNDKPVRRNKYEIYGAIWTDKGLIYVAKMNEKGSLCLL